jgi:pimeloyl-ACP methyl ester carboxylesterase
MRTLDRTGPTWERVLHQACRFPAWVVLNPLRRPPLVTPRAVGLPYQRFRLETGDRSLAAWYVPREGARAGIVLCHGHNDSRSQFLPLLRPLHEAGFHLLLFDHRSMGVSGPGPCTYGYHEQEDLLAAVGWLRRRTGIERLGVMGLSMGGSTALLAAARDPQIHAVVTDSAFARLADMVEQRFHPLPPRLRRPVAESVRYWAERQAGRLIDAVDPEQALRRWTPRPLLVIHGERDPLVPVSHARRLAEAAGEAAELWVLPEGGHIRFRTRTEPGYAERITTFFRKSQPRELRAHERP